MRGRGLKPNGQHIQSNKGIVAPHAGAWIETTQMERNEQAKFVAPHAGAWIETDVGWYAFYYIKSPPMRGRGLKRQCLPNNL